MARLIDELRVQRTLRSPAELREVRLAAGITQTRLAQELGVTRVTVARWEGGTRSPRFTQAVAWSSLMENVARELKRTTFSGSGSLPHPGSRR